MIAGRLSAITAADADAHSTDSSQHALAPGGSAGEQVYLDFDCNEATSLVVEQGLYGGGFRGLVNDAGAGFALAAETPLVTNTTNLDDGFGPTIENNSTSDIAALVLADPFDDDGVSGVLEVEITIGTRRIWLGTLNITAPAVFNATTSATITDFKANTDDTVTWLSINALDASIQNATFTLTTVPSGGGVILVLGAARLLGRASRLVHRS